MAKKQIPEPEPIPEPYTPKKHPCTWGEFKELMDYQGVTNDTRMVSIDWRRWQTPVVWWVNHSALVNDVPHRKEAQHAHETRGQAANEDQEVGQGVPAAGVAVPGS